MLSNLQRSLVFLLLLAASRGTLADDEIAVHLGARFGGEADAQTIELDSLDVGPAFGLSYSHQLRPQGWLWTNWSMQSTELDAPGLLPDRDTIDLDIHYLHVGTSYRSKSEDRAQGFVKFGLGLTWVDPPGEFDAELGASLLVGGGVRTRLREGMVFRFDINGYGTFTDTTVRGTCGPDVCEIDFFGDGAFQVELLAGLAFDF